jgi:glycolate oxidase FAD binding subunit
LSAEPGNAVWRISVRPSAGPAVLRMLSDTVDARGYLDWGGGLVWIAAPPTVAAQAAVAAAVTAARGNWLLMRAPESLRTAVDVIPPEPEPLARITRRVKAALDPYGILNPGRLYGGM